MVARNLAQTQTAELCSYIGTFKSSVAVVIKSFKLYELTLGTHVACTNAQLTQSRQ